MTDRSPAVRTALAVALAALALFPGGARDSAAAAPRDTAAAATSLTVLQMNLCNLGTDRNCYSGKAIEEAVTRIEQAAPDVVSVNEVCSRDLAPLAEALGGTASVHFEPAPDSAGKAPVPCADGDASGDAVLLAPQYPVLASRAGAFAKQDGGRLGQRVFACLATDSARGSFAACATHLSLTGSVALAQCRELVSTVLPALTGALPAGAPGVVAGDFNLRDGSSNDPRGCLPSSGFSIVSDAAVQHVIAQSPLTVTRTEVLTMQRTDHPALLVHLG